MKLTDVTRVLQSVTYRPGWEITAYEGRIEGNPDLTGGLMLRILAPVEDSYHPGVTVPLDVRTALPPMQSDDDLLRWLQWRLLRIETHESREWFKVSGKVYDNPHAAQADRDL